MKLTREQVDALHIKALKGQAVDLTELIKHAYAAGEAAGLAKHSCKGIPRTGCNYLSVCGAVCSKCGQIHHTHLLKH